MIQNTAKCSLKDLSVEIDLSQSQGKLIFDTTETGAGVKVYQPSIVTEGQIKRQMPLLEATVKRLYYFQVVLFKRVRATKFN